MLYYVKTRKKQTEGTGFFPGEVFPSKKREEEKGESEKGAEDREERKDKLV